MDFIKAKDTYRKNAVIQEKMAKKLAFETLKFTRKLFGQKFQNIFEIGSGTGFLTDEICQGFEYDKLFLNDITDNFTQTVPYRFYKGDILNIEIDENFDLIMSNAVFQWIEDKEALFLKLYRLLCDGGILAFTTFGRDNFSQIKNISGFGLNYEDLTSVIEKTGFKTLYFEEELETLYFENVQKILEHIKLTGVGTSANCLWTRRKFEAFKAEYLKHFSDSNGVELTYHPQYFILEKV